MLQLLGRWPESVRAFNQSIDLCRSFGGTFGEVIGEQRLAQIETAIGRFEPAFERLQRALQQALTSDSPMVKAHSFGRIYAGLSLNRYEAGDLAQATRFLASGFETQRAIGECTSCDLLLYPAAVPIYIAHGQLDLAEGSVRKAQETAAAFKSRSWIATAHHLAGLLAAARDDSVAASAHFEAAAESFEALQQPYDRARSLECLARQRAVAGSRREAEALVETAASLYEGLGAPMRAERVREILTPSTRA